MGRSVRVRGASGSVARCVRLVGGDGCSSDSRSPIGWSRGRRDESWMGVRSLAFAVPDWRPHACTSSAAHFRWRARPPQMAGQRAVGEVVCGPDCRRRRKSRPLARLRSPAFLSVPLRSRGFVAWGHDHPIKPPDPHREGLRHLCRRKHHHPRCAADRVDPRPPQRPPSLGPLRLPSPRRGGPAALQPAATGRRASKPHRCRPWREMTCHRECPPKPCCAFPTCLTASASADARCVDGAPTAHSPKPSGWARTPSAGRATSSTSGSPTGPPRALDTPR